MWGGDAEPVTVKLRALDTPLFGSGLMTLTWITPSAAKSAAVIVACNWIDGCSGGPRRRWPLALTNDDDFAIGLLGHVNCLPGTYAGMFTRRVIWPLLSQ